MTKAQRFAKHFHSEAYREFVSQLPCVCCGGGPCEVSHDPSRGAGGTWENTHPLTTECHRRLHTGAKTFWKSVGITREQANARTHAAWLAHKGEL